LRLPISCRVRKERRYRESINLAVRIEFPPPTARQRGLPQ
jgi:hypothetical protein